MVVAMVIVVVMVVAMVIVVGMVVAMVIVVVMIVAMVIMVIALEHVHGDIVGQGETVVALCFDMEGNHAVLSVGFVAMVVG